VVTDRLLHDSLWLYIPCAVASALLIALALKFIPSVHRLFVPARRINRQVQVRAEQAFYAKGLHRTRDHSGVLFFLSLFERKVWVLADQGIYRKISQEDLQYYASQVTQGMRSGRKTEALCAEITRFGKVLAQHFPIRPDDTNELANELIVEARYKR
jgi:putative membrane protein